MFVVGILTFYRSSYNRILKNLINTDNLSKKYVIFKNFLCGLLSYPCRLKHFAIDKLTDVFRFLEVSGNLIRCIYIT